MLELLSNSSHPTERDDTMHPIFENILESHGIAPCGAKDAPQVGDVAESVPATKSALIAAAPSLYEALEPFARILEAIEGHRGTPQTGTLFSWERVSGSYEITVEQLKAARAALKLARGE
jgi:hypothetical protein